jgi:prolyl 4-hydroxylase
MRMLRYSLIDNFLEGRQCRTLIELAKPLLKPSTTWNARNSNPRFSDSRRSDHMFFKLGENQVVKQIEQKIADVTHVAIENGEGLQVVRYMQGGYYKPHWDYFTSHEGNRIMFERGGQRIITVILYLNTSYARGSETYFPYINLKIEPKEGLALIWYNVDESGRVDRSTLHESTPVKCGEKWIATMWLREFKCR